MNTYTNQKIITVKALPHDKDNIYAVTSIRAMELAMSRLSGNAYKLWHYIQKNQNNYQFALSSKDACGFCGFGKGRGTYNRAIEELINNGYLIHDKNEYYTFYEMPK